MSTTTLDVLQGLKSQIGAKHFEAADKAGYHNDRYLAFELTENDDLAERELGDMLRALGMCSGFAEAFKLVSDAIDRVLNAK